MNIHTSVLGQSDLQGYVAEPEIRSTSGVLILPTIFGVNEFARGYANTLASAGLLAAVWDINSGLPLSTDYQECIRRARTLTDAGVAAMTTQWLEVMLGKMGLRTIGVLGFCIGGRFALLQAACDKRVRACAMAYPSIEHPRLPNQEVDALAVARNIGCPVHMLRPGKDHVTASGTYETLTEALLSRSEPTTIQVYPEAEHGFMHRGTPEANVAATALASPQLIAFLKACLG